MLQTSAMSIWAKKRDTHALRIEPLCERIAGFDHIFHLVHGKRLKRACEVPTSAVVGRMPRNLFLGLVQELSECFIPLMGRRYPQVQAALIGQAVYIGKVRGAWDFSPTA